MPCRVFSFSSFPPSTHILPHTVCTQGIFSENKEKLINGSLTALLMKEGDQSSLPNDRLEEQFHALRRLVASKAGYEAFTSLTK